MRVIGEVGGGGPSINTLAHTYHFINETAFVKNWAISVFQQGTRLPFLYVDLYEKLQTMVAANVIL